MSFIDYQALKNAYPDGNMAEAAKTLEALDPYHCLIAATPKTTAKITKMASSLPPDFLKWIEVCDGGMLFNTTMFCTESYEQKIGVTFSVYKDVNSPKIHKELGVPNNSFIFAESIGNDYFFFDFDKNDGKVYQWYHGEISIECKTFNEWLLSQIQVATSRIAKGQAKPLGIKLLNIGKEAPAENPEGKTKDAPVEEFWHKSNTLLNESLTNTDKDFFDNAPRLSEEFKENFKQMCLKIAEHDNFGLGDIFYIDYTFSYENIMAKKYVAEVNVYNMLYYNGVEGKDYHCVGQFDISFYYKHFDELWNQLLKLHKMYSKNISSADISEFMKKAVEKFYMYIDKLGYYAILNCVDKDYFTSLKKVSKILSSPDKTLSESLKRSSKFEICVGEKGHYGTTIYIDNLAKNKKELLAWFKKRIDKYAYCSNDYRGLNFSDADFNNIDFSNCDLRNCILKNVNFYKARLNESRLQGADLESVDLRLVIYNGTDFSGANLINANLSFAGSFLERSISTEDWTVPGFFNVSFRGANLHNATFRKARIEGADFTGANLSNVNFRNAKITSAIFTDAIMDGAVFSADWKDNLDLSPEQLKVVIFE